jgi:hypothetical protein
MTVVYVDGKNRKIIPTYHVCPNIIISSRATEVGGSDPDKKIRLTSKGGPARRKLRKQSRVVRKMAAGRNCHHNNKSQTSYI